MVSRKLINFSDGADKSVTIDGTSSLLLFSALGSPPFRSIKLRSRKPTCPACGEEGKKLGEIRDIDYVQFCGGAAPDWEKSGLAEGSPKQRVSVQVGRSFFQSYLCLTRKKDFKHSVDNSTKIKIMDVRSPTEFGICHLPNSTSELPANETHDLLVYLGVIQTFR